MHPSAPELDVDVTSSLTDANFLHDNPAVYDWVNPEVAGAALSRFAFDLVTALAPGRRVLDVGCGPGRELARLRELGIEADGLDASGPMVSRARAASPQSAVHQGLMTDFSLPCRYDALLCMGSTFLYNHTNDDIRRTLATFRSHLAPGGLAVFEMRSGAHYLTATGQALLDTTTQHVVETAEGTVTYTARLELDAATQLVQRHYTWAVVGREPVEECLRHRLLFPAEIRAYLEDAQLEVLDIFDEPAPALGRYSGPRHPRSRALHGRRMHVLARRPLEGAGR
jgi:SAM-dependent methyltransferase